MEIKRCPFCGGNAITSVVGENFNLTFKIRCSKCGVFKCTTLAITFANKFNDVLKAIDNVTNEWNERALDNVNVFDCDDDKR